VTGEKFEGMKIVGEVRTISAETDGQLARFQQPICPSVRGLAASYLEQVETQIRQLAPTAGLRIGPTGCKANLIVVVAPNGRPFIKTLKQKRPELLIALTIVEYNELLDNPEPAFLWQSTDLKRADGGSVNYMSNIQIITYERRVHLSKGTYQVSQCTAIAPVDADSTRHQSIVCRDWPGQPSWPDLATDR